ncbi:MAG: molybdopterin-dependent oxidoreductase, partial [Nitrospinaceae bacterium]|nr:molybdopterin-dependent oxidoreductase [Nitrospinaceae bacterium]NIR55499.1 molybdopterin-dependent oxidoreductase [Nitrospinaceae bacterium]NIS85931.1 molybdopterin-dependent oxidoreductase [Nitrospinaceae bacterium]NIT82779.1 molybdopterin-dependent oxidoreductase [Nitrospinaceae bacterium]NIU44983.1 molybdopterin-dependent oxidoreductase [Nitrospinaceae bacterium]
NGEPLTDEHGFPLRVIIPFKYGYKNPKAILKMEYVAEPRPGTWSRIGPYSRDGTILPGTDHPL